MKVSVNLGELPLAHPHLLWRDIRLAAIAVLAENGKKSPFRFDLVVREVAGFDDDLLQMAVESGRTRNADLARLRRTYEPARLVEFAAIAIAGLGLYYAGGHQIQDLAWRGSGADYLVDGERHPLEIAGRSRREDLQIAWQAKWRRLSENVGHDFYVCVAEFETPAGRLAFKH